jgi:hypothetical protein
MVTSVVFRSFFFPLSFLFYFCSASASLLVVCKILAFVNSPEDGPVGRNMS